MIALFYLPMGSVMGGVTSSPVRDQVGEMTGLTQILSEQRGQHANKYMSDVNFSVRASGPVLRGT
jgi:hypothetical protein